VPAEIEAHQCRLEDDPSHAGLEIEHSSFVFVGVEYGEDFHAAPDTCGETDFELGKLGPKGESRLVDDKHGYVAHELKIRYEEGLIVRREPMAV